MPFIPHTDKDIAAMLQTIGCQCLDDLFDEIPKDLIAKDLGGLPQGASEQALTRALAERAKQLPPYANYIGAGAYEHFIPAAVWDITQRGEFLTAYTPYQAEVSQGSLQLIYEYQTMMASLLGMEVANASLYEGASALAEAILMAVRLNKKIKDMRIGVAGTLHPLYRQTIETIVSPQKIELVELAYDSATGITDVDSCCRSTQALTAVVIAQPNFFGCLEAVDALTDWAHANNSLVIACVNPIAMALLKEPGAWGESGADIVCGEGQPLGVPLSSGGPYFGFLATRKAFVRQMPGRVVGRTTDANGKPGFVLTLQAREQHIRRAKATSNICTNQGLLVTAATIYMSLMGAQGLQNVASQSHANTLQLTQMLTQIKGVSQAFTTPFFHEVVLQLDCSVAAVLQALAQRGIQGGLDLSIFYPSLGNALLVCATETKTEEDLEQYANALQEVMQEVSLPTAEKAIC
jgi:glycine cleavage system P protein (glycine dehydrogenase) subunit 1